METSVSQTAILHQAQKDVWMFFCPGCECAHFFQTGSKKPAWQWNGDVEKPTVSPSILVNGDANYFNPSTPRCHSFVKDGMIQFLDDSTHPLAGKTVALRAFSSHL